MRPSVRMCVRVSLRNGFLKNKGAFHGKSPTTKRYTQVLDQINAMVSQILTKEKQIDAQYQGILKTISRYHPNSYEAQNKQ